MTTATMICGAADVTRLLITAGVLLALVASLTGNLTQWRNHAVELARIAGEHKTAIEKARGDAVAAARSAESAANSLADAVARAFEKGKSDAQALVDRDLADLRAGNLVLHKRWRAAESRCLSSPADPAREPDAAVDDAREGAGLVLREVAAGQALIVALQDYIRRVCSPAATWLSGVPR